MANEIGGPPLSTPLVDPGGKNNPRWLGFFRELYAAAKGILPIGDVDASGNVVATHLTKPLPISEGGTGARTAAKARANLGITGGGGGSATWGSITGTLSAQTDLNTALTNKLDDSQLDTDGTLAANSDAKIASQKAVKTYVATAKIRRVGLTIDGGGSAITTGVKGSTQVDFSGTIIGWSIEADQSGSITVEVDKHSGTQTVPVVPNTTTDKISASAPIQLTASQAAGVDTTGVSTWTTSVAQWDSIQFNVTAATTVQRVTLYLRIQEN